MILKATIENEIVRQCAENEVKSRGAELRDQKNGYALAINVVAAPERHWSRICGQEAVNIRRVAEAGSRVRQGPRIHLVEYKGVE